MAISDEDVIDELRSSGHVVDDYVIVDTDVCLVDRHGRALPLLIEDYPGEEDGALYLAIIDFLRRRGSPEYRSFEEFDEHADSAEAGSTKSAPTESDRRRTGNTKKQSPWWWTLLACIGVPIAYFFLLQARFFDQEERACAALSLMLGISVSMAVKGRFAGALFFASLLTLVTSFVPFGPSKLELFLVNAVPGLLSALFFSTRKRSMNPHPE